MNGSYSEAIQSKISSDKHRRYWGRYLCTLHPDAVREMSGWPFRRHHVYSKKLWIKH